MRSLIHAAFAATALLAGGCAMALEEPTHEVLADHQTFEIRRYAPYVVAHTTVRGSFSAARRKAFGRLFDYISGNNLPSASKAMTAEVAQQRRGEKIAMTIPVFSQPQPQDPPSDGQTWQMAFVMPAGATVDELPAPQNPDVSLRPVGASTVAVRRYRGSTGEARFREMADALRADLREAGIEATGVPVQAVYNGPFTLGPLRRNEVIVEIAYPADQADAPHQ